MLTGSGGGIGIEMGQSTNANISNCLIENYLTGVLMSYNGVCNAPIYLSSSNSFYNNLLRYNNRGFELAGAYCNTPISFGLHSVDNNKIINNTIINNTRGIFGAYTRYNNISLNNIKDNSKGIEFNQFGVSDNNIYHNNFIQNNVSAKVSSPNYNWNISGHGNYWMDYDSAGEGCNNVNFDQFCDSPYNISGGNLTDFFPYVVQDGWLLGPQVSQPIPVQVIPDVDMVKGKTTLIRIPITFTSVLSNDTITPNVTVYWNGTFVGQDLTTSFSYNETKNIDFWYVPQNVGNNLPISVMVSGTSANGINYTDSNSKSVNVVQTRNFTLTFVSVDGPTNFIDTAEDALNYINKLYPIKDDGVKYAINISNMESGSGQGVSYRLLSNIYKSTLIAGELPERAVGVVPDGWFSEKLGPGHENVKGYAKLLYHKSILVEEDSNDFNDYVSAHELGHTYGLCDEYNETDWDRQNGIFNNLCYNGDSDNDEILDSVCIPGGCPTSSLEPLSGFPDSWPLGNMMGSTSNLFAWIAKDSYEHIFNEFKHESPEFKDKRVVISGIINKTSNTSTFDQFYTIGSGLAFNLSEYVSGSYSIEAYVNNTLNYKFSFNVSFLDIFSGGETIENNETAFEFTLPYYTNLTRFVLKENNISKYEKNVSANIPNLTLISPIGGQTYSNEEILVNWSASDIDPGTNLSYAVLFSSDNGMNYRTLIFDYNSTWFNLSSNNLGDSDKYLIKVLATDGVNTNFSLMNRTFEIDNDLQIRNFSIIYQNNTEAIFRIILNNTLSQTISNITWEFNGGQNVKTSQYNINLQPFEESLFFIYHNYSVGGNYNVSFKARSNDYIESETIEVII